MEREKNKRLKQKEIQDNEKKDFLFNIFYRN